MAAERFVDKAEGLVVSIFKEGIVIATDVAVEGGELGRCDVVAFGDGMALALGNSGSVG